MVEIPYRREFDFDYVVPRALSPLIRRVVARNPSPFTSKGTGTYIIGKGKVAIVDPGPDLPEHIEAVLNAVRGETVEHILVTHTHIDHSPATPAIQRATGAPSFGFGPHAGGRTDMPQGLEAGGDRNFVPDNVLRDGDVVDGAGYSVEAVHTPGHTSNHLCYALNEEKVLFTGDHVMGWSTSIIAPPDGSLGDYMRSLDKLMARDDALYWPTHGAAIDDPKPFVRAFIAHRNERTEAILKRLAAGDEDITTIVSHVYQGYPPHLQRAARHSVLAHLQELAAQGKVESDGPATLDARYKLKKI